MERLPAQGRIFVVIVVGELAADAVGIGSPLFKADRVASCDWHWLRDRAAAFVEAYIRRGEIGSLTHTPSDPTGKSPLSKS